MIKFAGAKFSIMETSEHLSVVDSKIVAYLASQTAASICTCDDNVPYSCICFYAYSAKYNAIVFKSSAESCHVRQALNNSQVSGTVLPDKLEKTKVRGLQFSGTFFKPEVDVLDDLKKAYYKHYPIALAMKGEIWAIQFTYLKFTDNTLGFGKKIVWSTID